MIRERIFSKLITALQTQLKKVKIKLNRQRKRWKPVDDRQTNEQNFNI